MYICICLICLICKCDNIFLLVTLGFCYWPSWQLGVSSTVTDSRLVSPGVWKYLLRKMVNILKRTQGLETEPSAKTLPVLEGLPEDLLDFLAPGAPKLGDHASLPGRPIFSRLPFAPPPSYQPPNSVGSPNLLRMPLKTFPEQEINTRPCIPGYLSPLPIKVLVFTQPRS